MEGNLDASSLRSRIAAITRALPAVRATVLRNVGAFHTRAIARRFVPYGSGSASGFGGSIQRRSGATLRTSGFEVSSDRSSVRMFVGGPAAPGTAVQEYGGTIYPKRKKYLTVPLRAALTPSGVLRGGARLVDRGGEWFTADGRPTVIFAGRGGTRIIAEVRGAGRSRRLTPLYALRKSVTLRPRLGFLRTFREDTVPYAAAEAGKALRTALS